MSLKEYTLIIISFINNIDVKGTILMLKTNGFCKTQDTIYKYFDSFRKCLEFYYEENIPLIELTGTVEIDEMYVVAKRRGRFGRLPKEGTIIFGMISRDTKQVYLTSISDTSKISIHPIIIDKLDTDNVDKLISDSYSTYINNRSNPKQSQLSGYGFNHQVINHSEAFVDPLDNSIHTNNIERVWRSFRKLIGRTRRPIKERNINKYISTYMFQQNIPYEMKLDFFIDVLHYINDL